MASPKKRTWTASARTSVDTMTSRASSATARVRPAATAPARTEALTATATTKRTSGAASYPPHAPRPPRSPCRDRVHGLTHVDERRHRCDQPASAPTRRPARWTPGVLRLNAAGVPPLAHAGAEGAVIELRHRQGQ